MGKTQIGRYLIITHSYYREGQAYNKKILHKAHYNFFGYATNCYLKQGQLEDVYPPFKSDEAIPLLTRLKDARGYDKICPYCFPNGLEQ